MKEEITKLVVLARLDNEIDNLMDQKNILPRTLSELQDQLEELESQLSAKKEKITNLEKERKQKELELNEQNDWIHERESKLTSIKTNKEYHAALKEIEQAKKGIQKVEDEILNILTSLEEETPKLTEIEESTNSQRSALEQEIEQKKKESSQLDGQISEKVKFRAEREQAIKDNLLRRYKTIKNRLGKAMALVHQHVCLECNTTIPPQLFIELQKLNQLVSCPRCHRILYTENGNSPQTS